MPFVVIKTPERIIIQVSGTQAAANAFAAPDATFTAHQGDVAGDPQPGQYLTAAGVAQSVALDYSAPSELSRTADLCDVELKSRHAALMAYGQGQPISAVHRVHDIMTYARQAGYIVARNQAYTVANRIKYLEELASGPTDGNTDSDFYEAAGKLAGTPNSPTAWVALPVAVPQRHALAGSVAVAGNVPDGADAVGGFSAGL